MADRKTTLFETFLSFIVAVGSGAVGVVLEKKGHRSAGIVAFFVLLVLGSVILTILRRRGVFGYENSAAAWDGMSVQQKLAFLDQNKYEHLVGPIVIVGILFIGALSRIGLSIAGHTFGARDLSALLLPTGVAAAGLFLWCGFPWLLAWMFKRKLRSMGIEPSTLDR